MGLLTPIILIFIGLVVLVTWYIFEGGTFTDKQGGRKNRPTPPGSPFVYPK